MLLLLGAGLLFVSLVVALSIMGVLTNERRAVARSVAAVPAASRAPLAGARAAAGRLDALTTHLRDT